MRSLEGCSRYFNIYYIDHVLTLTQKVFPRFFFVTFYVDQSNKRKSVHNAGKSVF